MNITSDITTALAPMSLVVAVGAYIAPEYPDAYVVLTPLGEQNDDEADDAPLTETTGADVNLYKRGKYEAAKDQMKALLKTAGLSIAASFYGGYENDTKHHHWVITVENKEVL